MEQRSVIDFVRKYARNHVYSQNGEEGILEEVLLRLRDPRLDVYCVEIGGHDGKFCSNTAHLIDQGAHGKFVEADYGLHQKCAANWAHRKDVISICSRVGADNVNAFVDDSCDVLSLDTDGSDFKIFKALKAKPKIVIIEIDSSIDPESHEFNADGGSGFTITLMLGFNKGYFLLAHTGNMIFVDNQYRHLFPEIIGDGLSNAELYFNRGWLREDAA